MLMLCVRGASDSHLPQPARCGLCVREAPLKGAPLTHRTTIGIERATSCVRGENEFASHTGGWNRYSRADERRRGTREQQPRETEFVARGRSAFWMVALCGIIVQPQSVSVACCFEPKAERHRQRTPDFVEIIPPIAWPVGIAESVCPEQGCEVIDRLFGYRVGSQLRGERNRRGRSARSDHVPKNLGVLDENQPNALSGGECEFVQVLVLPSPILMSKLKDALNFQIDRFSVHLKQHLKYLIAERWAANETRCQFSQEDVLVVQANATNRELTTIGKSNGFCLFARNVVVAMRYLMLQNVPAEKRRHYRFDFPAIIECGRDNTSADDDGVAHRSIRVECRDCFRNALVLLPIGVSLLSIDIHHLTNRIPVARIIRNHELLNKKGQLFVKKIVDEATNERPNSVGADVPFGKIAPAGFHYWPRILFFNRHGVELYHRRARGPRTRPVSVPGELWRRGLEPATSRDTGERGRRGTKIGRRARREGGVHAY